MTKYVLCDKCQQADGEKHTLTFSGMPMSEMFLCEECAVKVQHIITDRDKREKYMKIARDSIKKS